MVGDFISLHPEEWMSIIDGLFFSAMLSKGFVIFIPVILLAVGASLFIWLSRLEREGEWTGFLLWLITSSIILISIFKPTTVVVELNPTVLVNKEGLLSLKSNVQQEGSRFFYQVNANGISSLLSIPDRIASLVFYFLDIDVLKGLSGKAKTIPLNNIICDDPRAIAALSNVVVVGTALDLSDDSTMNDFKGRVEVFKKCYENNFDNVAYVRTFAFKLDVGKFALSVLSGATSGFAAGSAIPGLGNIGGAILGSVAGALSGLLFSLSSGNCSDFIDVYNEVASRMVAKCDEIRGISRSDKEKKMFVGAVLSCIRNPSADEYCSNMKERTLSLMEQAENMNFDIKLKQGGTWNYVKDKLSEILGDLKESLFSATYADFTFKFNALAKGQGIVLALFTAAFPFIALISIIPIGKHFINWPLLLDTMIGYFLVKLWIPLVYFLISVSVHIFAAFSTGV
jgi:hypothetical protein